jgi:hypothetical protein
MTDLPRLQGFLALLLAVASLAAAAPARAWGPEGHRLVGLVADELLDARSRAALRDLAGDESLAEIGLWMDQERERMRATHPGSEHWHYDNRPVCDAGARPASYCPGGRCASGAWVHYLAILGDRRADRGARLEALRIVVHVMGDVHQPMHVADHDDRGGNDVEVRVGKRSRPKPLHAAWDNDFVKRAVDHVGLGDYAHHLVESHRANRGSIEAGGFAAALNESYDLAQHYAYGRLTGFSCRGEQTAVVRLSPEYSDGAADIVAERLARAGIRLAAVLRATL